MEFHSFLCLKTMKHNINDLKYIVMDKMQLNLTSAQYRMLFTQKKKVEELFQVIVNCVNLDPITSASSSKTSNSSKTGESSSGTITSVENEFHSKGGHFTLSISGNLKNQKQAEAYILALMRPEIVHIFAYHKELQIIFGSKLWIECLELTYGVCISDDGTDYVLTVSGTEYSVTLAVSCMQGLSEQYEASKNSCVTSDDRLQYLDSQLVNAVRTYRHTELPIHRYSLFPFIVKNTLLSWLLKAYDSDSKQLSNSLLINSTVPEEDTENMEIGSDLSVIIIESDPEDEQHVHNDKITHKNFTKYGESVINLDSQQNTILFPLRGQSSLSYVQPNNLHVSLGKSTSDSSSQSRSLPSLGTIQNMDVSHKLTVMPTPPSPDIEIVDVVRREVPSNSVQRSKDNFRCRSVASNSQRPVTQLTSLTDGPLHSSTNWASVNSHVPSSSNRQLRPIVIDGNNVAMSHGKPDRVFSCRGIALCIEYFLKRGHNNVTAFVPQHRRCFSHDPPITNQYLLEELALKQLVVFTPSRKLRNKRITSYDDRFIVDLASRNNGVIVSNDYFRDLMEENEDWRRTIESRLLMYCFVGDIFMVPLDPLGRHGPHLDQFLSLTS